jgi:putative transposase
MKTLRRFDIRDRYYFITTITYKRRPILLKDIDLFWRCWDFEKPLAWVLLPDHFHVIIKIRKVSISIIMHDYKIIYFRRYRDKYNCGGKIWQNRFWDHIIRDPQDMKRHLDYTHYNPVKHGFVNDPFLYEHSSLKGYHHQGFYQRDWGVDDKIFEKDNFGE